MFLSFITLVMSLAALAANDSSQTFTLDGELYQSGTTTLLLDSNAKLKIQIIDSAGNCLLYEEEQILDTYSTKGRFTVHVGSATGSTKRTVNDPGRTMAQVFQNVTPIAANSVPGRTCAGASYMPFAGAIRYFRLIVTPSATLIADTLQPDLVIDSVPSALVAQSVQGLERNQILQTNTSGTTVLSQANLEAAFTGTAYTNLQAILGGNFMRTDTSGASLPSYASTPAGVSIGDIWFDTSTNQIKYQTSGGVQTVGAAGSGSISSLTVGSSMSLNGSVAGTISNGSGTIDLADTGVGAGTYTKVVVDTKGRVTAGTVSLVEGDIPNLSSAGKVSGNAITSGTISGSTSINTSGNLVTTGTVSGLAVQATNVRLYNGSNYIQLAAPALGGLVNLTLPSTDGNPNEFLKTDGSGVLSWATATVTSTDVTAALGYTPLSTATTFAGDVSGTYNSTVVQKIQGKSVTAASVSGQIMIYDGTAWTNNVVSGDATLAHNGFFTLNTVPVAKGGTNATSFGNNRIIASNGTGTALQDFTCSLNQVIAFDASGYATCASIGSISAAIFNGGNTTSADISIGTNDNKALKFKTNNTVAMTISQSGNVGIGTASPASTFHVSGSDTTGNGIMATVENTASSGQPYSGFIMKSSGATYGAFFAGPTVNTSWGIVDGVTFGPGSATQDIGFRVGAATTGGGAGPGVIIKSSGYVGIGISTPAGILDVQGGTASSGNGTHIKLTAQNGYASGNTNGGNIYLTAGTANGTGLPGTVVVGSTGISILPGSVNGANPQAGFTGIYSTGPNRIDFGTNGLNRFSVLANGNVVMGSETTKIVGNNFVDYGTNANGLAMDNSGTYLKTQGTARVTVDNTGNIGVGGAPSSEKFEVVGNIKTSGCLYYASSSLGTCASDERIKEGVRPFELGLEELLGIVPVHFKYNGLAGFPKDGKEQLGVIAQQVEKVAPQLIQKQMVTLHKNDPQKTEIKVVDYGAFTYLIINSIKDFYHQWLDDSKNIHRELASVQSQMAEKDQKIKNLQEQNESMKHYFCQKDPSAPFCKN